MTENRGKTRPDTADDGQPDVTLPAEPAGLLPAGGDPSIVRRTRDGWRVGGTDVPDLTCAMVLADLLASELPAEFAPGQPGAAPGTAPPATGQPDTGGTVTQAAQASGPGKAKAAAAAAGAGQAGDSGKAASQGSPDADAAGDAGRMRTTISQLEHALVARIRVEQAIGVLAERHRIQPRQAFEQLRGAARNRGKRVIDIASDVVASASNPLLQLPDELSRPRSGRRSRRPHSVLEAE